MRLIDADMLKTKVNHNLDEQDSYLPVHFSELIDSTPTFELKKSSWIEDENRGLVCGNCKEPTIWKYRFCPYCGAYMVNDKEQKKR